MTTASSRLTAEQSPDRSAECSSPLQVFRWFSMRCAASALLAIGLTNAGKAAEPTQIGKEIPLPRPEAMETENVPQLPITLVDEVSKYTEARAATALDWHPEKPEMLISTRFGNSAQVHRVKIPGGARSQLTFFSEPVTTASYDPIDGSYFLFTRDTGGNEFSQIYRYDFVDGTIQLLTDGKRSQNSGMVWSNRGDQCVYSSTQRNGADRDIWIVDPKRPESSRILCENAGGGWSVTDWSPDDTHIAVIEYLSVTKSVIYIVNVATGEKRQVTTNAEDVSYGAATFSADGKHLTITSDANSEFKHLEKLSLDTNTSVSLPIQLEWDVEGIVFAHDRQKAVVSVNEAGISKLYLLNVQTNSFEPIPGIPSGVITPGSWHKKHPLFSFSLNFAQSTSDVYVFNSDTMEIVRWTESELGGLIADQLSTPSVISWKSFDDRIITGLYYPANKRFEGKRPVMINIHGGPEGQSRPIFLGRNNYYLNELGVAMIYPNVRGSVGYGKTYVKLDNGLNRLDSVKDIGALLDWIKTQPELDADRVMVMGGSYGGYMTLACAVEYNDRIRCALDVVGISHFGTFLKNTESYRRDLRRVEYGDERDPEIAAFFDKMAPLNNAHRIKKPMFIVQGGNDPRVPLSEAEQMFSQMQKNGQPVWYMMAKDEGHGFRKKNNADYQFYATIAFVKEHLIE